ncbi:retrotransposon protein, putative, ty1-copia subclass [Tanacetum coccineum]
MVKRMANMNTRLNIKKLDENIVQKHGGSKQVGFKQLSLGVEGVYGVHDEKRVWFEVELQGAQGDRKAEVFQVSNDDNAVAQRRLKDNQPELKTNTDCLEDHTFKVKPDGNVDHVVSMYLATVAGNAVTTAMAITGSIHQVEIWATKGLLDKAKGNVLGIEIVKDQSDRRTGFLWILTMPWKDRSLSRVDKSQDSRYELRLVAGIATGALVKGGSQSEVPAQVNVAAYRCCLGKRKAGRDRPSYAALDPSYTYYVINPTGTSVYEILKCLNPLPEPVVVKDILEILKTHNLFIYVGHGDGLQHIPIDELAELDRCAAAILMGCCSGLLELNGPYTPEGRLLRTIERGIMKDEVGTITCLDLARYTSINPTHRALTICYGMALPVQNINHSAFRSMFEKEKLSGNNFNDWFARLKLVLRVEKKIHVIEQPLPPAPEPVAEPDIVAQWTALYDAHTEIACLMLGSMTPELHRQFELYYPFDMIQELRSIFEKQPGVENLDLIQSFHACKQEEGKPVADYVLKMKGYVEKLERLGYVLPQDITVVGFVRNYNMHNMRKTIGEIHAMFIEYEMGLPKKAETPQVMMIKGGKIQKANKKSLNAKGNNKVKGKGNDKKVYIPKPKNPKPTAMERPAKDDACHHCKEVGHWKRNCPVYLDELLKKKKQVGSTSSLVSKNDVLYFNAIARNGIYEIDMHDLVPNVNSIYSVSNKRVKRNLDSTYLWHCRLAHINKKRIKQLQQDGLLKSTDDESFDKCESCLSGKMTKKPFSHSNERAKVLLGIIHTDHKHEVFETFKVFKNEVENQLGKTIKAIRSDRGSEYISQEFKDYLKANEIVQQLTPPYTPQHNGVSERRNRTLLDMVRSMINLTTLPLSFWDYDLESATRILIMVPTKKTDRDDTKSQIGYVFVLNGGAVDWKSSSKVLLQCLLQNLNYKLLQTAIEAFSVHYANEPGVQRGARHYQRRYHYVRECVELGEIRILKVHTDNNLADPFTKALSNRKLTQHARSMGLRPASSFM